MRKALRLIFSFALVFGAVVFIWLFISPQSTAWYDTLVKPDFTPPGWVFTPIWLVLYALMAFALARVLSYRTNIIFSRWCFAFGTQLVLNVFWAILFFDLHGLLFSMIDAICLWFVVVILTASTWELDRFAFWLLVPYLAWSTFALILSVALWWVN